MAIEITTQRIAAQPIVAVRRRVTHDQFSTVIPKACGEVWNFVKSKPIANPGRNVAVYLDTVFNIEVGVEIPPGFKGEGEFVASSLPGGEVATATHLGPYQQLGDVHRAIQKWRADHGFTEPLPCWEVYGHWQKEWNTDPSKIRTDVFYLLKK